MLEPPAIPRTLLTACLQEQFGLQTSRMAFLPLGADVHTAVYRLTVRSRQHYFLKLRSGSFDPLTVTLPSFLAANGNRHIIAPLATRSGQLWAELEGYKLILYPFVEGTDAYQTQLSDQQWLEFGQAVKNIHRAELPEALQAGLPREQYNPHWRERVKAFQAQVETETYAEPTAAECAAFIRKKQAVIEQLVTRAERLASELQTRPLDFVLCHADLHAGNLLLTPSGSLYIVDWDNPILAPKEHDLMHIGATESWGSRRIKSLFYRGYGEAQLDGMALAYYRLERIICDIAEFCTQLLSTTEGGQDRPQSLTYLTNQFLPGQEVDLASRGGGEQVLTFYVCSKDTSR